MSTFKKLGFLLSYLIPALIVLGYYAGGGWNFAAFIFTYGIIPVWDEMVGKDPENIRSELVPVVAKEKFFSLIVYSLVYIQLGIVIWACYVVSLGTLSPLEYVGLLLGMMTLGASGINVAHELGHKKSKTARFHSKLNLMTVCYMHFYIEHNKGHHVHVATPKDPATSKKNQSFYGFWWQSVVGGFLSAWQIERKRLERQQMPIWNPFRNQMLQFILFPVIFVSILTLAFSWGRGEVIGAVPVFFFLQSLMAFSTLESVNYIEHYGILRREVSPGRYERVNPLHSWNSNHMVSNFFLFQLQRHSDHHAYASRPYQVLRHFDESPQLPAGYPVMIILSLMPPLWFKLMNPRLEAWQAQAYDAEHIEAVVKATA